MYERIFPSLAVAFGMRSLRQAADTAAVCVSLCELLSSLVLTIEEALDTCSSKSRLQFLRASFEMLNVVSC